MDKVLSARAGLIVALLFAALIGAAPHDPASSNADAATAFNLGATAFNAKHYADAIDAFTRAIALDPSFAAAYRNRGAARALLDRNADAIVDYTTAIRLDPSDEVIYVQRGEAFNASGDHAAALGDASRAIGMDGNDGEAFVVRGSALAGLGRFREALAAFKTAGVLQPNSFSVSFGMGLAHLAMCDNTHAIADFNAALGIRDDSGARNDRGVAFMGAHAFGPALSDYARSVALDPRSSAPLTNRGILLTHLRRYAAAETDLDAAIAIDSMDPAAYVDRALLYIAEHRLPRALQDASHAASLVDEIGANGHRTHPPEPKVYRLLADVYAKLGMSSLAGANRAAAVRLAKASGVPECPTGV